MPRNHKVVVFGSQSWFLRRNFQMNIPQLCFSISYAVLSSPALTLVPPPPSLFLTLELICVSCLVCCSWVQSGPLQASSASSGPSPPSLCSKYLWQPHTFLDSSQYWHQKKALLISNSKLYKIYTTTLRTGLVAVKCLSTRWVPVYVHHAPCGVNSCQFTASFICFSFTAHMQDEVLAQVFTRY